MTIDTTHGGAQLDLSEVDIDSPPNDHLGDYRELQSPYEASVAAQQLANTTVPDDAHDDPAEVREDVARFAAAPYAVAPVRQIPADSWTANDFLFNINENRVVLADFDPYRKKVTIYNHTDDSIFISPNPNATFGWGSSLVPPDASVELTTRSRIYGFTLAGYNPGATQNVSVITERYA